MVRYSLVILATLVIGYGMEASAAKESLAKQRIDAKISNMYLPKGVKVTKEGILIKKGSKIKLRRSKDGSIGLKGGKLNAEVKFECACFSASGQPTGGDCELKSSTNGYGDQRLSCEGESCCELDVVQPSGLRNAPKQVSLSNKGNRCTGSDGAILLSYVGPQP